MGVRANVFARASLGVSKVLFKRKNGARSAKIALHTLISAFGRYETIDKNCNSYSKDALRQGCKRVTVLLQQDNKTFG